LRRRRRQTTQIIRKKTAQNLPASSQYSLSKASGKGKKVFYSFLIIIVIIVAGYYLYNLGLLNENSQTTELKSEKLKDTPTEPIEEEKTPPPFEHKIQIEILNGCGVNGIAKIFQSYLREKGFDVVNTENYTVNGKLNWQVEKSFVIDQIGVSERAKAVAKSLGIPLTNIESRENPQAIYDVSVVIGKDYKKLISQ
jgi:hypothetical protein